MIQILALSLCACGALPNPAPPSTPAPWQPQAPAPSPATAPPTTPTTNGAKDQAAPPPQSTEPDPSALVIARVAGRPIDVRELLAQWLHRDSLAVQEQIDQLVLNRLVLAEATRMGIRVEPEAAESAYQKAVAAMETEIARKRPGVTLDLYVDSRLGLDPLVYRERLRDDALRGLLAERAMRGFLLSSEHARIRVIVVDTEDKVREVETALAAGEAFDDVARRLSSDSSAEDGGRVAPVVRADHAVSRLAFETAIGAVGGPAFERSAWLFVRVEDRPAPLVGGWADLAPAVEKSLAERGIENLEMQQWQTAMLRRYEVDVTPFFKLVGHPTR